MLALSVVGSVVIGLVIVIVNRVGTANTQNMAAKKTTKLQHLKDTDCEM